MIEKVEGKRGVRISYDTKWDEYSFLTMRNGFQWHGCPVDRELLVMMRDAINEHLAADQSTDG